MKRGEEGKWRRRREGEKEKKERRKKPSWALSLMTVFREDAFTRGVETASWSRCMGPGGGLGSGMEGGQSAIRRYRYGGDPVIGGGCTARGISPEPAPRSRASGRHPVWGSKKAKRNKRAGYDSRKNHSPDDYLFAVAHTHGMDANSSAIIRHLCMSSAVSQDEGNWVRAD